MSNKTINITESNNLKELLHMFQAAWYIQENIMYVPPNKNHQYGYYKKGYMIILDELKELHKDISDTLEGKMFRFSEKWSSDLFDIIDGLIKEEYGEITDVTEVLYFDKYAKKYLIEYLKTNKISA